MLIQTNVINHLDGQAISNNISGQGGLSPLSLNFNHCLSDLFLLLTYKPILDLPEHKLKVAIICEMHNADGFEVVVL